MTPPTPQATRGLLAVCPDMAKLLTVVTLRQAILGSACLHFDDNVIEIIEFENCFLEFSVWGRVTKNNGRFVT
jgi:hypothetical protein